MEPAERKAIMDKVMPLIKRIDVSSGFQSYDQYMEFIRYVDEGTPEQQEFCYGLLHGFNEGRNATREYDGPYGK